MSNIVECDIQTMSFNDRSKEREYIERKYAAGYELKAIIPVLNGYYASQTFYWIKPAVTN